MGLSQDELAHRVGIGRQALSAIENGGDFKVSVLRKIAVVLNCSTDELLYGVFSSINEEMQDNIMNELKRMSKDEIKKWLYMLRAVNDISQDVKTFNKKIYWYNKMKGRWLVWQCMI